MKNTRLTMTTYLSTVKHKYTYLHTSFSLVSLEIYYEIIVSSYMRAFKQNATNGRFLRRTVIRG
jgi:hypothetical protein